MLTDRVRVRWPVPTFGVSALAVFTGFLAAFFFHCVIYRADEWAVDLVVRMPLHPVHLLFLLTIVCLGAPALTGGVIFARNRSRLLFGVLSAMSAVLAAGVVGPIFHFTDTVPWVGGFVWTAFLLVIAGTVGILATVVGAGCRRLFGARLIEQDGTLCWGCAYPVGKSSSAVCPECGRPANTNRRRGPVTFAAIWLGRHRVLTLLVAVTLWGGTFAVAWREGEPRRRFIQTFDPGMYPAWVREHANKWLSAHIPGSDSIGEDGVIIVMLHQERAFEPPRIWLIRGYQVDNPIDTRVVAWSLPTVIRKLDVEETREALRNGLSEELLNELRDEMRR